MKHKYTIRIGHIWLEFVRRHATFASTEVRYLMVFLILFLAQLVSAKPPQPEAIAPGQYTIGGGGGGGGGGGRGSVTIPSYCLDERLGAPGGDNIYRNILGGSAVVRLPNGSEMPLQAALENNIISISGTDGRRDAWNDELEHEYDKLKLTGPTGAVLLVGESLALTAEPWLQHSSDYKIDSELWKKFAAETEKIGKPSDKDAQARLADSKTQSRIWDAALTQDTLLTRSEEAEYLKLFGASGIKLLKSLSNTRDFEDIHLSRLGKQPVLLIRSLSRDDFELREDILIVEGGQAVLRKYNSDEATKQIENIHVKLGSLATRNAAFLVKMYGGGFLFIAGTKSEDLRVGISPIILREWIEKAKPDKLNLILLSDDGHLFPHVSRNLQKTFGDSVRILEDDDPELAVKNVAAHAKIKSGKDVAIYWDPLIQRAAFVPALAKVFKDSDISLHRTPDVISAGNLIIVSGHKASSYRNYLADLAGRGVLKGKSVALLSCGEDGDREFSRYLIKEGGAVAVLRVNETIPEAVMPSVLRAISDRVGHLDNEHGVFLEDLIKDAVKDAEKNADTQDLKDGLEIIMDHAIQISQLSKPNTNYE